MENIENKSKVPLSAEDLLVRLREGKKTVGEIRMGDLVIPIRVLSCDEFNAIRREAIRKTALIQGDLLDRDIEIEKNTLKLASTVSTGGGPFLGDKLLSMLAAHEMNYLYSEYVRFSERFNPSLEQIQPEEFKELVNALKKKEISPRELSLMQLRAICTSFVELILKLENQT